MVGERRSEFARIRPTHSQQSAAALSKIRQVRRVRARDSRGKRSETWAVPPINAPLTQLLQLAAQGERGALDQVFAVLYPELRKIAHARLRSQGGVAHLDTTALVHESFLKLIESSDLLLTDRKHFFAYAAKTMRNIIIDFAREQLAERRGGGAEPLQLNTELANEVGSDSERQNAVAGQRHAAGAGGCRSDTGTDRRDALLRGLQRARSRGAYGDVGTYRAAAVGKSARVFAGVDAAIGFDLAGSRLAFRMSSGVYASLCHYLEHAIEAA